MPAPLRIGLLHPQRAWVEALEQLVTHGLGLPVTVAHTSLDWVLGAVQRGDVDVVLVGVEDRSSGREQVERLLATSPPPRVIALSESQDPDLVTAAVRAGAKGWVRPTASARELADAIQGVARGETWLPPDLTTLVLERLLTGERQQAVSKDALADLSARELEILGCLTEGMTRAEIAERFTLSPHTVRTHINHILRKLDAHSTLAAVLVMRRSRLPEQRQG